MNENLTEIVCVIDRSGSMEAICSDAIGGFNTFLQEQKEAPGQANLTLVLFDHEYLLHHNCKPIQDVEPLDKTTYVPRGMTALLDAVGRTIDEVGKRLSQTPEPERPSKVIFAILTDGLENSSTDYTNAKIASRIDHQRKKYSWDFLFLAANQDAFSTAQSMSIDMDDTMSFEATSTGIREAYASLDEAVMVRRRRTPK